MDPLIWASLINAAGGIGQQFMGQGSSVSDAKRLMYHQQLYWNDRFKRQAQYTKGMLRNYGPRWQFKQQFNAKMRMANKHGIHPLAMLRGGAGFSPPPSIYPGQPSAQAPPRDKGMDLQAMGQDLSYMVQKLLDPERKLDQKLKEEELKQQKIKTDHLRKKDMTSSEYDYIGGARGEPAEEGTTSIGKPVVGDQAIKTAMGRIKVIPAEILGEAYDASPFQKAKGFLEETSDLLGIRFAWKHNKTAYNSTLVKRLWRVKSWLHQYLKVPANKDIRIDGRTGTWYSVPGKARKLWLDRNPGKWTLDYWTP